MAKGRGLLCTTGLGQSAATCAVRLTSLLAIQEQDEVPLASFAAAQKNTVGRARLSLLPRVAPPASLGPGAFLVPLPDSQIPQRLSRWVRPRSVWLA